MSAKTVQFRVEVKDLDINSGNYQIYELGNDSISEVTFQGNTFSAEIDGDRGDYYAVVVFLNSYNDTTITGKKINLLATFRLSEINNNPVTVCPESSIASIYAFAQMISVLDDGSIELSGTERNLKIAYGMKQNFYNTEESRIAEMIKNSPNGLETNSYSMFNSLCNLLYYCLTDTALYNTFLELAWHEINEPNSSFLGAVRNMIYDPFWKASEIYQLLTNKAEIYTPSLIIMDVPEDMKAPNNWTLTIKNNTSGSLNFLPSGLGYVVFDADDNAWIGNNFRMGSAYSGTHCLVYKYNATPANFSPVQGGGLLGVGFGTAIDNEKKLITMGNFGWGSIYNNPQEGSISRFNYKDGAALSPTNGISNGVNRVQGMNYDSNGNLWMASIGCQDPFAPAPSGDYPFEDKPSAVVVYLDGKPENMLICDEFPFKRRASDEIERGSTPYLKVFDVCPNPNELNTAFISCIGTYNENDPQFSALSAVYKVAINRQENSIDVISWWISDYQDKKTNEVGFESFRQVTTNSQGDVIVVGVESSRAVVLHNDLSLGRKAIYQTSTYSPWGVKVDANDTVFLANFAEEKGRRSDQTLDMLGPFGVTMLRHSSDPTTARLLTVPTGGSEVMLANGFPLYGTLINNATNEQFKCFEPLMRLTSTNIDGAGNVWCMNNWKPSAEIDVKDNPGGDGPVIFIGIAAPE